MSLFGKTVEEKIWNYLKVFLNNDYGVAGLMGNLYAESGLKTNNLQNSYNKKLNLTDEEYTAKVNSGEYKDFVQDKAGYGLAQWTYWSRKQNLKEFLDKKNKPIDDLEGQLDFLATEIKANGLVYVGLINAKSVLEASNLVLMKFEKPADQGENVQKTRANYGNIFYQRFVCGEQNQQPAEAKQDKVIKFTNSPLVSYTRISPNRTSPRRHTIDTITIHCMAGNLSVESCGNVFAPPARKASSNYGIDSNGKIGMYVEECDRSWCTSNSENDNRAVTIEVANDGGAPDWHVSDAAMDSLIKLCADICKRNNIKELKWQGNKELIGQIDKQNMTVHRWFAPKACPGEYLFTHHAYIASETNKLLGSATTQTVEKPTEMKQTTSAMNYNTGVFAAEKPSKQVNPTTVLYRVRKDWLDATTQIGAFNILANAIKKCNSVLGYYVYDEEGNIVYSGPFLVKILVPALNIRKGPGTNYPIAGCIKSKGVFTITEVKDGFGKLKSGAGWISLDPKYAQKR